MKKLLSLFVKYPFYGKVFILMLVLFGTVSMLSMRKSYFPVVESKVITVSVTYQGATPKEMEEGVVSLMENAIRGIVGIKEHSSVSQENMAVLTVVIKSGYNVDRVLYDVKNAIDAISNFPQGAERPVVSKQKTITPAVFVSLSAKNGDLIEMRNEAVAIEDEFMATGLISQIEQDGLPRRIEMSVEVDEVALTEYHLTLDRVKTAISEYNRDIYGGIIRNNSEHIKINIRNRSVDPEDIEEIVVFASPGGVEVKVKDIAKVVLRFEDVPNGWYRNKERAVMLRISTLKEEDLQKVSEYIEAYVEEYNANNVNMKLTIVRDFLDILEGQLGILYSNGVQGILLVILCLSLFLNFRISLWVAWGIPASFLGMFVAASLLGITLNVISLFGMILIIGILVDDGIVIGENIYTYRERGYSPQVAAIKGTMDVLPAVLVSVATTIIAFTPLLFIEGGLEMMFEMAVVVIACLVFSVLEGMFVLPGHLASEKVLSLEKKRSWYNIVREKFEEGMAYVCNKVYIPYLRWSIGKQVIVLASVLAMFIITLGLYYGGRLHFTFFPPTNDDNFSIDIALKPGTTTEVVLDELRYIEEEVAKVDSMLAKKYMEPLFVENFTRITGSAFSRNEQGEHAGMVRVFLRRLDRSKVSSDMIKKAIADNLKNMPLAYKFAIGASTRFGAPVSISLFNRDGEVLLKATERLKKELNEMEALYNVIDNNQLGTREVHLKLKPLAYTLDLTAQKVMNQVRAAFYGTLAQRIQEGRNEIWFYIRYPESNSKNMGDLEDLMIRTANGGEYPLYELCDFHIVRGVTKINHFNGSREIRIDAFMLNPQESVLPILEEVSNKIMPELMETYPNLTYMYQGQLKDSTESMESIALMFGVAFALMMLILIIYFRSFLQGFLIILMVPIATMAAVWGHLIEGVIFSMISIWGMVALSGTIINNAVVFMARYNGLLVSGMTVADALIEAGRSRFRPIVLTSVTTIMGLFPLINETSSDAAFVKPMAISLGYGILIGTIFILAIFPALIKAANTFSLFKARLMGDTEATAESVENAVNDILVERRVQQELLREDKDECP